MSVAGILAAIAAATALFGIRDLFAVLAPRRSPKLVAGRLLPSLLRGTARALASSRPLQALSPPGDLRARLAAAGEPAGFGVREWLALKVVAAAAGLGFAVLMGAGLPPRLALLALVASPAAAFVAPDLYLARLARRRVDRALRDLPDMLDLLRVSVEAGLHPARALGVVAATFGGPLASEWSRAAAAITVGARQEEALEAMTSRLPADELGALARALDRSRRHGAPLGRALAAQAARARHARARRLRERAARAGPKIQLVVALLLVPSVLLMVAAGILAELEGSGLGLGR